MSTRRRSTKLVPSAQWGWMQHRTKIDYEGFVLSLYRQTRRRRQLAFGRWAASLGACPFGYLAA